MTNTAADTTLTAGIKGISICARNSDAYYALGNGVQGASAARHYIASGERLDLYVSSFAAPHIAIIFGPSAAAAVLQISELS